MTIQKETLVPLDESDFISHSERQKQKIHKLEAALAEKDREHENQLLQLEKIANEVLDGYKDKVVTLKAEAHFTPNRNLPVRILSAYIEDGFTTDNTAGIPKEERMQRYEFTAGYEFEHEAMQPASKGKWMLVADHREALSCWKQKVADLEYEAAIKKIAALAEKEEKIQAAMEAGKMLKEQRDKAEEQITALTAENKRLKGVLRLMANAPLLETAPLQQVKAFIRKAQEALRGEEEK